MAAPIKKLYAEHQDVFDSAFRDPVIRQDLAIALFGGMLSSVAAARAYGRLTPDPSDNNIRSLLIAAGLAMATGTASLGYKLFKASAEQKKGK